MSDVPVKSGWFGVNVIGNKRARIGLGVADNGSGCAFIEMTEEESRILRAALMKAEEKVFDITHKKYPPISKKVSKSPVVSSPSNSRKNLPSKK